MMLLQQQIHVDVYKVDLKVQQSLTEYFAMTNLIPAHITLHQNHCYKG